jgi:hypothetical protein
MSLNGFWRLLGGKFKTSFFKEFMSGCFQALADFTSEEFGDISKHKVICGSQ